VTIFGESAGAISVAYLMLSPMAKGEKSHQSKKLFVPKTTLRV